MIIPKSKQACRNELAQVKALSISPPRRAELRKRVLTQVCLSVPTPKPTQIKPAKPTPKPSNPNEPTAPPQAPGQNKPTKRPKH